MKDNNGHVQSITCRQILSVKLLAYLQLTLNGHILKAQATKLDQRVVQKPLCSIGMA